MRIGEVIPTAKTWCKMIIENGQQQHCVLGAMLKATTGIAMWHIGWEDDSKYKDLRDQIIRLAETIRAVFPERVIENTEAMSSANRVFLDSHIVANFNNHRDTTFEDIQRVCKVADLW